MKNHYLSVGYLFFFLLLGVLQTGPVKSGDLEIGVFTDKRIYTPGEIPRLSITGFNRESQARTVDVHVVLIGPDGTTYEYPDWNTVLQPWLPDLSIPSGFEFPATFLTDTSPLFPSNAVAGVWQAAVAFTEPGTLNLLSVQVVPFTLTHQSDGTNKTAVIALDLNQSPSGLTLTPFADFISVSDPLDGYLAAINQNYPDIDQCVFEEYPLDFLAAFTIENLDVGDAFTIRSSTGESITINRGQQVSPDPAFFQTAQSYTVEGKGGSDIAQFNVTTAAPPIFTLTEPGLDRITTMTSDADFPIRWEDNGGIGEVFVHVVSAGTSVKNGAEANFLIDCRFSDDGEAVIPANVIAQLKANTLASPQLTFAISRSNSNAFNTIDGGLQYGNFAISSSAATVVEMQMGTIKR